ncbi:MAG: PTS sugar transporter subunit IIA [Planctomycetaceae bacterium]|jgi:PTS system fructose-specific IIA component/PTS system nitrogen regulatory IIA component|nr:PTS sugar transporter subunit IIA [Planctomycetaceae bacterium]
MKFADFILREAIRTEIKSTTKEDVIREMVQSLLSSGGIKEDEYEGIVKAIIRREELGSTGLGRGIAVPHSKHPSVDHIVGTVAISQEGVDFDSLDCEKVYLFFLVVSPPGEPGEHLRALEHITRQLRDETFCRFLKQSKTQEDVCQLLNEADDNMFGK